MLQGGILFMHMGKHKKECLYTFKWYYVVAAVRLEVCIELLR